MTSLTSTAQGPAAGSRQGSSRRAVANQLHSCSISADTITSDTTSRVPNLTARRAYDPPTMLWELLRYPSGDAHAQLYWRRRISVLAVLGVILLLVVMLALRGGGPDVQPASAEVSTTEAAGAPPPLAAAPAPPSATPSAT